MKQDTILNAVLIAVGTSAVVLSTAVLARSFRGPVEGPAPVTRDVSDWRRIASVGHRMGSPDAKVQIVEFSDFQCPYCKRSASDLRELRAKYANSVSVIFRHYPLEQIHPHARDAALASECAARQARFEAFHDALFQRQDSLGLRSWTLYARTSAIPDIPAFTACLANKDGAIALLRDVADADSLGVLGTPTILVNGRLVLAVPSRRLLDSLVQDALRPY